MRRTVSLLLAFVALVLPSAALAQSAGDEQYADPFGQVEEPSGNPGQQTQAPAEPAPATTPAAPAQTTTADPVASQETGAPTLPRTGGGLEGVFFAVMGATLLLAGTTIRRLAS